MKVGRAFNSDGTPFDVWRREVRSCPICFGLSVLDQVLIEVDGKVHFFNECIDCDGTSVV